METRRRTDARAHLREMRARNPGLQAEYDRLGPRYELIGKLIAARKRAGLGGEPLPAE